MAEAVPMTKLEAVNAMLHDIGDRPVNTLTGATRLDVVRAIDSLEHVSRAVQLMGWWFNDEIVDLALNGDDQFAIPETYVRVEAIENLPDGVDRTPHLVVRAGLLYDRANATNTFAGAGAVRLSITRLLEFEDLPSSAREYIYASASIRNQSRTIGSQAVDGDLRAQAASAYATMQSEDFENENYDQTYAPTFIDMMHRR